VARCVEPRPARAAAGKLADKAADEGPHGAIVDLGRLYGLMRKNDDELQVYQEALEEVRGDIAHASTPQLEIQLSRILTQVGQMYMSQYRSQITNGAKGDKRKCTGASASALVLYHSPGSRVLVEGLQKQQQHNGIEGVVVEIDALRMRVRLDMLDNKELMLKSENVCPLLPTAPKLQEQLMKLHDLAQERIASSKEVHRIQIKVKGVKHVNTGIACETLGLAYLMKGRPADTGLAVSLLIQADKIRRRVGADDKDMALWILQNLSAAQASQARFDEGRVLSAVPYWWLPTSRQDDETKMARLFAGLQARNGKRGSPSMSSEAMQQGLRLYGLFNVTVTASACDAVSGP